jgi:hypothetical protein
MNSRSVLIATCLCGASACDTKLEPIATAPITLVSPLRVYVTTTPVQPLEHVPVYIDGGNAAAAIWTSSDESVATISRGTITGISPGDATMTASMDGRTGSTVVHVGWRPETRLFMGSPRFFLDVGSRVSLFPALVESSGRYQLDRRDVEWTTSNPSIARVDTSGTLTTFAAGTTTIIGRFRGLVDSAVVDVGGLFPSFGYFYSGDVLITAADYYDDIFWTPPPGKSFSTAGVVSATWEPPYASKPDLGWVGPNQPLRDAFIHVVSLENVPCAVYAEADSGFHFVDVGSPLVECHASQSPFSQSVRMELVAFRPREFNGTLATIYPNGAAVTTSAGGIVQTSATTDSRSYAMSGIARDSVFWFVTAGAANVGSCWIVPSGGSLSQAAALVTCDPLPFRPAGAAFEAAFYAMGFGANARHGSAPIGFAEVSNGVITRKAVDGLDIATNSAGGQSTDIVVSGASLAAFDRVPAVLVTAIGLNSGTCGISEPVQSTPTMVRLTVKCTPGLAGFTLGVIY